MVIKEITLDEKIQILHGVGWSALREKPECGAATRAISVADFIPGIPRLGIPYLQMSDSVDGVAGKGTSGRYATALPSAEAMAGAWDPALSYEVGNEIRSEVRSFGFNMSLDAGPPWRCTRKSRGESNSLGFTSARVANQGFTSKQNCSN
jgi:beta-glucosidase